MRSGTIPPASSNNPWAQAQEFCPPAAQVMTGQQQGVKGPSETLPSLAKQSSPKIHK